MKVNEINLDFRPDTSIYATYKRLSYSQPYAIAEFIDNSTASYFEFKEKLEEFYSKNNGLYSLNIYILYDPNRSIINIVDNAYGMELEDFKRAVLLGKPPKNKSGRNEFGMGLKTAASWICSKWTVESSRLGSEKKYSVTMDIDKISNEKPDFIPIKIENEAQSKHYTKIILENLDKPVTTKKQKEKLVNILTGIYRRDISQKNIKIIFAERKKDLWLDYEGNSYVKLTEIPSLKFIPIEPRIIKPGEIANIIKETKCLRNLDAIFEFNGKKYVVKGFIGIRKEGSRSKAGFTLFRRGRAIIGGYENNYRPKEVFADPSSFTYLRLYGELDLDDFPVNQAKDGFSWDDGLEDAFINLLKDETSQLKYWSTVLRKTDNISLIKITPQDVEKGNRNIKKMLGKDIEDLIGFSKKSYDKKGAITTKDLENTIYFGDRTQLKTTIDDSKNPENWISIKIIDEQNSKFEVIIHIGHLFFKPYTEIPNFIIFLETFSLAYVSAVLKLRSQSRLPDKTIDPIRITRVINDYLLEYAKNSEE